MPITLPTKDDFEAVRFALWNIFEIALMIIAMAGVIVFSLKHIPTKRSRNDEGQK